MGIVINLVATRSKDGDHHALVRWYHDHVHLLLGFAGLQGATLYRRIGAPQAAEPEYLCLYEFASHAEFLRFEVSPARALAQQVVQAGWGRDGIEIVQRTQYLRLGQRVGQGGPVGGGAVHHIQLLGLGAGELHGVARWLADRVFSTLGGSGFGRIDWHRACSTSQDGGDALVVAESQGLDAASGTPLEHARWAEEPFEDAFGQRPACVVLRWQGAYQRLASWAR